MSSFSSFIFCYCTSSMFWYSVTSGDQPLAVVKGKDPWTFETTNTSSFHETHTTPFFVKRGCSFRAPNRVVAHLYENSQIKFQKFCLRKKYLVHLSFRPLQYNCFQDFTLKMIQSCI